MTYLPTTNFLDENEHARRVNRPHFTESDFATVEKKCNSLVVGDYDELAKGNVDFDKFKDSDSARYGLGIFFFFDFTRFMSIALVISSLLSLSSVYFNYKGTLA